MLGIIAVREAGQAVTYLGIVGAAMAKGFQHPAQHIVTDLLGAVVGIDPVAGQPGLPCQLV